MLFFLGTFGALATQSFHETKNVTCGEGGALIINDASLVERAEILREKGTERPYSGKLYKVNDQGTYTCAACGNELFTSDMKFDAHCGWPSFDKEIVGGKVKTQVDKSHGMIRTEIMCARCDSHLGHLFDDGPTETGMRYCVNSLSLNFIKKE